jgi:hypothetical protein
MKAQNLRAGAMYCENGRPAIVVLTDADAIDSPFPDVPGPVIYVRVRFVADGGQEPRYFEFDDEVPYENTDPRDED